MFLLSRCLVLLASRPASSSSSIIHPLVSGAGQASSVHRNVVPALESTHLRNSMAGSISRSESMASRRTDTRPATVAAYHDEQQLNQMLPPKRELPFLKSSQGKPRASSSIQRGVEPRQLQASLTGNPSGDQAAYPMTERNASEGQELFIPDSQQSQPLTQTQPPAPESQPSPMSSQVQPLPYPGVRLEPKQPLAGAVEPDISAEQPCNSSNFDTQNEQAAQPMPRAVSTSVGEQLALYVSRPTPERTAFLENWMCELIEDDNFMTLCQDVEGTWRRFAFGMKG